MLLAGVFFLFAIVGLLSDLTAAIQHGNWWHLAFTGLFSGAVSAAYVVVIVTRPAWLALVVIVQIALTMYIASWTPVSPALISGGPLERVLTSRLMTVASAVVACVSSSWFFLISWVTKSGRRYVQLDTELHLARDIHRALVPRIETRIGGFDFLGVSSPSGEVGGDLVDVVEHDGDPGWTAYLVDVSGHGVPSGVLMGMVKSAVRMALTTPAPFEPMLSGLNEVLYDVSQPQMFATFAALRPAGPGRIAYTLAGHLPILCWRAATGAVEQLVVSQVPLGMLPGRDYVAAETSCAAGDVFLVLTDGLTEVFDRSDREFGMEGVQATFAANAQSPLPQLEEALLTASRSHGTQLDDQSLILIRVV
jgi:sigma-B regulation protein RsbU (phosphoserine phosphatase)